MQLTRIKQLTATLIVRTGLHIGAGDTEMRIEIGRASCRERVFRVV